MRRFRIPSVICLAVLAIFSPVRAQNADTDIPRLYRQFRVLSSLPWKEPGATRQAVLARIFREPNQLARDEVLREYLHTTLPVEDFRTAFDECIALEQADFPGAAAECVMRAWAERDPAGALRQCLTLFDLVIDGAPREFTTWSKPISVVDLEKARASTYWFGSRRVLHACWKGLRVAELPEDHRKALEAVFVGTYVRRFQKKPHGDIEEPAPVWEMREEFLHLLAAPPEQIPRLLKWPREPWKDVLFARALIRWMNGDAKKAPQIVEHVLDAYDPRRYYRNDRALMDVVPAEFLVEWAILDRDAFMAWVGENSPGIRGWRAEATCVTVMPKENQDGHVLDRRFHYQLPAEFRSNCYKLWITLDPHSAFPSLAAYGYNQDANIHDALDEVMSSDPPANYWRGFIAAYIDSPNGRRAGGNEAAGITSKWGPVDFAAMVQQYGLPWCLHSGEYQEAQVARILSNRQAMENSSALRDTFSALRTWAILRPKEMRAWIDGEKFKPDLREALLWLLDNAAGGIPTSDPTKP